MPVDPDLGREEGSSGRPRRGPLRSVWHVLVERGDILAVIAVGGAVGSAGRWALLVSFPNEPGHFPAATFWTNVSGGLALGILMVFVTEVWSPSRYVRPFLGVGVLGGFTTFSTYMLETRGLLVDRHTALAGAYLFGSLIAGLLAVWTGVALTRAVVAGHHRRVAVRTGTRSDEGPAEGLKRS